MAKMILDGREMLRSINITVKMPRSIGFRFWVAAKLFAMAGWVSGTTLTVDRHD